MPWYNFHDYEWLSAVVSPWLKECLEQVMLQYHQKVRGMIKTTQCSCPTHSHSSRSRPPSTSPTLKVMQEVPIKDQFDHDDNLGPMDTPVQDESVTPIQDNTMDDPPMAEPVTEAENHLLDGKDDNIRVMPCSQGKQHPVNYV